MNIEEQFELSSRIRELIRVTYKADGITISKAQEILGGYADADHLIQKMWDDKILFQSAMREDEAKYEFTFEGLQQVFKVAIPEARDHYGVEDVNEDQLLTFVTRHW
jgi:hypothetical protein